MTTGLLTILSLALLYFLALTGINTVRWLRQDGKDLMWSASEIGSLSVNYIANTITLSLLGLLGIVLQQWWWPAIGLACHVLIFNRVIKRHMAAMNARGGFAPQVSE